MHGIIADWPDISSDCSRKPSARADCMNWPKVRLDWSDVREWTSNPGDFTCHDPHQVHRVANNTDKRCMNVLIELK